MRALAARDVTDNIGDEVWSLNVEPLNLEPPQGFERSGAIERLERLERAFTFRESGFFHTNVWNGLNGARRWNDWNWLLFR
jgi:hypothetical protein